MKEKIGIEKLIRYLLESKGEEYKEEYYEWYRDVELEQNIDSLSELKPFIKWLVENDKIDFSKVKEKIGLEGELYDRMLYWYKEEDFLIMIISIENEPIRFLCEILK